MIEEITNDINVTECCFYNNGKCNNPNGMACNCCNNIICYFKELKRLEAKNTKLKEEIKALEKKKNKRITFLKQMVKKLNHEKACAWGMLVPIPYSYYDVYLWGEKAFGKEYVEKVRKVESEEGNEIW